MTSKKAKRSEGGHSGERKSGEEGAGEKSNKPFLQGGGLVRRKVPWVKLFGEWGGNRCLKRGG